MTAHREPTDAQMEGYEYRRAGAAPTASQWDGMAADDWAKREDPWANARQATARAQVGTPTQFREAARLARENARLLDRLRLAENAAALFRDHLKGCQATPAEEDALIEWRHAAGFEEAPDGADDYPRAEDMA